MSNFFNGGSGSGGGTSLPALSDNGTVVTSTEPIVLPLGSGSNTSLQIGSLATTGFYGTGSNTIRVSIVGSDFGIFQSGAGYAFAVAGGISLNTSATSIISTPVARTFRFGTNDSASPAANTVQLGESSRGGTDSNVAGASGVLKPGIGTGNGAGTKIVFQRNLMGASGSTAQSVSDSLVVGESKTLSNTSATATSLANISVPSNSGGGCWGVITVVASDGTNFDSETQSFNVSYVNKAGVLTIGTPAITASTAASNSGSTTIGITVTAGTNSVDVKVTPVFTTIVPTTVTAYVELFNHGTGNVTIN